MTNILRRWLIEEDGQDLIEYALLCSCMGFAAATAVSLLGGAMKDAYISWDTAAQSDAVVEVPNPQ
jgi:Flp pilus assembly pilin Flp